MVNPFLSSKNYDTKTAVMLERANITDIGNAVAYTDGERVFINTPENLEKILPAYDDNMLKLLLWHEQMHMEFKHHRRYFKYVETMEKSTEEIAEKFNISKEEVNIIMDILVHDWLLEKYPELTDTAKKNLAQLRYRNALKFTFKTYTLEEMLTEYADFKKDCPPTEGGQGEGESDEQEKSDEQEQQENQKSKSNKKQDTETQQQTTTSHSESQETEDEEEESEQESPAEHDQTDWSELDNRDSKEFITKQEGDDYIDKINELKNKKIKLAQLTQTLNGLVTTTNLRTYKTPSYAQTGQHTILKGRQPVKASLYLCFDASGSMSRQLEMFKSIISQSIPQAMQVPTEWFSGWIDRDDHAELIKRCKNPESRNHDYYKGTFKDFMPVYANNGYSDDGDRTIELCWKAEQMGYSPIGITDGGWSLSWSVDKLKELKRTILVGQCPNWLKQVQEINPKIQIINVEGV